MRRIVKCILWAPCWLLIVASIAFTKAVWACAMFLDAEDSRWYRSFERGVAVWVDLLGRVTDG